MFRKSITKKSAPPKQEEAEEGAPAMPPKKELERLYASLLEDLAIPEAKRDIMIRTEDDERKWKLIQANASKLEFEAQSKQSATSEPSYWVAVIDSKNQKGEPSITPDQARELEAVMRTGNKQFLIDFIAEDGVRSLLGLTEWYSERSPKTDAEKKVIPRVIECYKALMNNHVGMQGMLDIDGSITTLALAMDLTDLKDLSTAREVILLLAVTCFFSAKGRNLVVKAMDGCRRRWREESRFSTLVDVFSKCQDNEFRAAVIMFITTIVNSAANIDTRVRIRNDFLALDIMNVFKDAVNNATEGDEFCVTIATQFQVFEDMMVADHAEVVHRMLDKDIGVGDDEALLDLSNQNALFDTLVESCQRAGTSDQLLEISQALLLVPTEPVIGKPVWRGLIDFVREATNYVLQGPSSDSEQKDREKPVKLNYNILHSLLEERIKLDKKLSKIGDSDDIIRKQRKKIEDLNKQLKDKKSGGQVKKLNEDLELYAKKCKDLDEEVATLKKANFQLQNELRDAKSEAADAKKKIEEASKGGGGGGGGGGLGGVLAGVFGGGGNGEAAGSGSGSGSGDAGGGGSAAAGAAGGGGGGGGGSNGAGTGTGDGSGGGGGGVAAAAAAAAANGAGSGKGGNTSGGSNVANSSAASNLANMLSKRSEPPAEESKESKEGEAKTEESQKGDGSIPTSSAAPNVNVNYATDPKYKKYWRMKKAGLPAGAVMNAMGRDGVMCPLDFFDEETSEQLGIVAKKGDKKKDDAEANGPQKTQRKPRVPMRGIFWTKIPPNQLEGTIWPELNDDTVKLDIDELEANFCKIESGTMKSTKNKKEKSDVVHIVDGKKQQNVGIGISRFRATNKEIKKAILRIDDAMLSLERAKALIAMAPTNDEWTMLQGYEGDFNKLTIEDQFLYEMTTIPRLQQRLNAIILRHTFDREAGDVKGNLDAVRAACIEVERSTQLKKLLEIILAIGNYLNGGTPRGGAWGFKLEALQKLEAVKENKGKRTLLHYIVHVLEQHYPDLLELTLPKSEAASTISMSETHKDLRELEKGVRLIKKELDAPHPDKDDRFVKVFGSFQIKAQKLVDQLSSEYDKVLEDFSSVTMRFGEKDSKLEPESFFAIFVRFQSMLKRAHEAVLAARARAEKQRKMEEEKQKRLTMKKQRKSQAPSKNQSSGPGGVIEQFKKANEGDASAIVSAYLKRRGSVDDEEDDEEQNTAAELKNALQRRKDKADNGKKGEGSKS